MFKNVPERLEDAIRNATRDVKKKDFAAYIASGMVIIEYLGILPSGSNAPSFIDQSRRPDGNVDFTHAVRVESIAESLFLMRSTSGFAEMCRRFKGRDFRSTFYELFSARLFVDRGFDILSKPETGVRGEDFDFSAKRNHEEINVEVTALTASQYSSNTVKNALGVKRKQIPAGKPAIIICVTPESWLNSKDIDFSLMNVTFNFFKQTRRVNAVMYVTERHIRDIDGNEGALIFTLRPLANVAPRNSCSLDALFRDGTTVGEVLSGLSGGDKLRKIIGEQNTKNEFFRWMEYLIPELREAE